jgi:hypothetical protein
MSDKLRFEWSPLLIAELGGRDDGPEIKRCRRVGKGAFEPNSSGFEQFIEAFRRF